MIKSNKIKKIKEQKKDEQKDTKAISKKEQQDLEEPHEEAKVQNKLGSTKRVAQGYVQSKQQLA